MALTAKNYDEIARLCKHHQVDPGLALSLAKYFKQDNSNFKVGKFLTACGFDGTTRSQVPYESPPWRSAGETLP